jgi:hypothetical protein
MRSTLDRHFLYRPHPALRIGIQVRAARRQRKRWGSTPEALNRLTANRVNCSSDIED